MQNIKELLNKIKAGELDWNTIKRSISEMDRELRLEIFSYIESKSDAYHQPLTMWQADILTAMLLDGDEYLRKRVSSFTAGQLAYTSGNGGGNGFKALPFSRNNGHNQQSVAQITDQTGGSEEASILNDLNVVLLLSKITDRKVFNDNHPSKVGVDAYDMAGILGLSQDECNLFYIAGLLHDIGYLDIPSEILNKKATLTDKEFAVIRTHTAKGLPCLILLESRRLSGTVSFTTMKSGQAAVTPRDWQERTYLLRQGLLRFLTCMKP
jgi:response regulator RpfG family c-di-GMP phosphodiesterase